MIVVFYNHSPSKKSMQMNLEYNKVSIRELVSNQKEKFENLHQNLLKKVEQLGEQDGTLSLPRQEDESPSPNEGMIKYKYQKLIAECFQKGKPYLDRPHLEHKTLVEKIDNFDQNKSEVLNKEMSVLEQRKQDKLDFITDDYGTKKSKINSQDKYIQRDYSITKKNLQTIQQKVGRLSPIIHFKSTIAYMLLLIGIGICELPLNLQIFQKFGEAFFITIIMAGSLAIAIPLLAHFTGVFIKQRKEKRDYTMFAILCVAIFGVFNFGISIFRANALAENISKDPDQLSVIIFTCLNLILFIIGVLAAYFRHDESYELEYSYNRFQKEKKKYDVNKREIQEKRQALDKAKIKEIKAVQQSYLLEKAELSRLKDNLIDKRNWAALIYDELLNSFVGLEDYLNASYNAAVQKYRAVNLLHRKDHISPKSWSKGIAPLDLKFNKSLELDPN